MKTFEKECGSKHTFQGDWTSIVPQTQRRLCNYRLRSQPVQGDSIPVSPSFDTHDTGGRAHTMHTDCTSSNEDRGSNSSRSPSHWPLW